MYVAESNPRITAFIAISCCVAASMSAALVAFGSLPSDRSAAPYASRISSRTVMWPWYFVSRNTVQSGGSENTLVS